MQRVSTAVWSTPAAPGNPASSNESEAIMQSWNAKDTATLRSLIKSLENSLTVANADKSTLTLRLKESQEYSQSLEMEVKRLTTVCATQALNIEHMAKEHAGHIVDLQERCTRDVLQLRSTVDRLVSQLSMTQLPQREAPDRAVVPRPLDWSHMSRLPTHPVHVLRRVILQDEKREDVVSQGLRWENCLERPSVVDGKNDDDLAVLLDERDELEPHSEDDHVWRGVCKRIHQVLTDRRRVLHTESNFDDPEAFLLRTRHMLVSEWVAMHRDVDRLHKQFLAFAHYMKFDVLSGDGIVSAAGASARANNNNNNINSTTSNKRVKNELQKQVDVLTALMKDIVVQCVTVEQSCFSGVDKSLHPPPKSFVADSSSTQGSKDHHLL